MGQSYGDNPSYQPVIYDPSASSGSRFSKTGKANVARLYHSSATLLPDGSILVSGSSPRADVSTKKHWSTHYSVERFYPDYYDEERPSNKQLPSTFTYGGDSFEINLGSSSEASKAKVVIIRTGFSTHGLNMGQRMIELKSKASGSTLQVAQLPPNANLFAPGPALAFVVVDGVPSEGKFIMVGNGKIGKQTMGEETDLSSSSKESSASTPFKQAKSSKKSSDDSSHENMVKSVMDDLSSSVKNVTTKSSHALKQGLEKVTGGMLDIRDEDKAAEAKERSAGLKRHKSGHANAHERIERSNI